MFYKAFTSIILFVCPPIIISCLYRYSYQQIYLRFYHPTSYDRVILNMAYHTVAGPALICGWFLSHLLSFFHLIVFISSSDNFPHNLTSYFNVFCTYSSTVIPIPSFPNQRTIGTTVHSIFMSFLSQICHQFQSIPLY